MYVVAYLTTTGTAVGHVPTSAQLAQLGWLLQYGMLGAKRKRRHPTLLRVVSRHVVDPSATGYVASTACKTQFSTTRV